MARTTYAQTERRSADLASEFGRQYAERLFGVEAIASLPVRQSGKNKGQPKGHVCWIKTTSAGYSAYIGGGVSAGVVVRAWIGEFALSNESEAMQGRWMGRVQGLCGSRSMLGSQAREREAAEQARSVREQQEYLREMMEAASAAA